MHSLLHPLFLFTALSFGAFCACGSSSTGDAAARSEAPAAIDTLTGPRAANLHNPLPGLPKPLLLSGNFGELRNNHFHSGLDFKTGGRTGAKVVAADSGFVSRVVVSPWGFGRAVYVEHPRTGLTTVYGHLESFAPKIDERVRGEQYARESFAVDLRFAPGEIPLSRGEMLGLSGNAGSSGGPHLHMDVRHTASGDAVDPLPYFRSLIADNVAPSVRSLAVYPVSGKGFVASPSVVQPAAGKTPEFSAWGKIYPAIKAYDRMTSTHNIYGVKHLALEVDGQEVYRRTIDRFGFDDTRAVHTLVDYPTLRRSGSWMMVTRVPEADPLFYMVDADTSGIIDINAERTYKCAFILEDAYGNRSRAPFNIIGRPAAIKPAVAKGHHVRFDKDFRYEAPGITVSIPAGALYDDLDFTHSITRTSRYLTPVHHISDRTVPLHRAVTLSIDAPRTADPSKLVLVRLGQGKRRDTAVDSRIENGRITARVTNFGSYAVTTDTIAPVIRKSKRKLAYVISDNLSGIARYRGEIDGKFALFEFDGKNALLSFTPDKKRFPRTGRQHEVVIYVTDAAGNSAELVDNVVF